MSGRAASPLMFDGGFQRPAKRMLPVPGAPSSPRNILAHDAVPVGEPLTPRSRQRIAVATPDKGFGDLTRARERDSIGRKARATSPVPGDIPLASTTTAASALYPDRTDKLLIVAPTESSSRSVQIAEKKLPSYIQHRRRNSTDLREESGPETVYNPLERNGPVDQRTRKLPTYVPRLGRPTTAPNARDSTRAPFGLESDGVAPPAQHYKTAVIDQEAAAADRRLTAKKASNYIPSKPHAAKRCEAAPAPFGTDDPRTMSPRSVQEMLHGAISARQHQGDAPGYLQTRQRSPSYANRLLHAENPLTRRYSVSQPDEARLMMRVTKGTGSAQGETTARRLAPRADSTPPQLRRQPSLSLLKMQSSPKLTPSSPKLAPSSPTIKPTWK